MATQFNVPLVGMKNKEEKARIGSEVVGFMDANKKFAIIINVPLGGDIDSDSITLKTCKDSYTLHKSLLADRYEGTCGGIKVHVILKKISGKVIYWSHL